MPEMSLQATKIDPNAFYTTEQLSKLLGVHRNTVRKLKTELNAKRVGRSYKFLGKSILNFLGSSEKTV